MIKEKTPVIFSDFDGTITEHDVIVMIMERFAPFEWLEIKNNILYKRTTTLKDGVEKLFSLIESNKKNEIVDFVKKEIKIRKGFSELLDFCRAENVEFNVVSGGLDFFIYPVLEKYLARLKIYCNIGDFNSKNIKIDYKHLPVSCNLCGDCGCCKIEIIEKYPKEKFTRILIGDSLTDLAPSKVSDIVFARADLIKYLEQDGISNIPFNDFYEVKEQLQEKLLQKI